ncbi:MAG TPA: cytochrome c, class I [Rhodocyclaceae bacterium]|nr:cytochrome c, class I [Rhodocyclaceae bacterium]
MEKPILRPWLAGLIALVVSLPAAAAGTPGTVTVKLPDETARFKPGPGVETAARNCTLCHSADYIYMQPPLSRAQWQGEVTKMRKVYGAPIEERDTDAIVGYLLSQNGKPE